jgi:hypothetical protein
MPDLSSDDDIDAPVLLSHLITLELEARIWRAFTRLKLILPTVPRTYDMRVILIVGLGHIGFVWGIDVNHARTQDPFASRSPLMQAVIAIGVIGPLVAVHANLEALLPHDAHISVLKLGFTTHEHLPHFSPLSMTTKNYLWRCSLRPTDYV